MAVFNSTLGVYNHTAFPSSCPPHTAQSCHLGTFGPVVTFISATISSGSPPPGMEPFVCPGGSSALWMIGAPEAVGVFVYQIDALMSDGSHTFWDVTSHTIALGAGCPTITITPAPPLPDAFEGVAYNAGAGVTFAASAGLAPFAWDLTEGSDALPAGLSLSGAGVLSGTPDPATAGTYNLVVRVVDDNGCTGVRVYALEVLELQPIVVLPVPPIPDGIRGVTYEGEQFTATGGTGAPYDFTIEDGELPPGLELSIDGELEGLPTAAGSYTFTVRATDPDANFGEREYTIDVAGLRIIIAGEDVTIEVAEADLELGLNRQATGSLEVGDGYIPARGADVLIYARDGVTPIFGGLVLVRRIQGMTESNPANRGNVDLVDYSIFFEDADPITIVSTVSQDLEDVIAEIVLQSLAVYGITYTPTATGQTVPPIEWVEITVPDAFKRITDATGVVFRVLPLKALDVFVPLADPAPVSITDANVNAFDLSWQDPPNLAKNTVDLLCGPTGNGVATQRWTSDGIATEYEVDIQAVIGDAQPARSAHAFIGYAPATNFADGETVTLGSSTYTFRAALVGDVAGEVLIGADGEASLVNLIAAITNAGGAGYAPSTPVNADATAFLRFPDQLAANALVAGAAGNSIPVSDTAANSFWYGEGTIPLETMQLGSDASGAAGWTQGYILEDPDGAAVARTISVGAPGTATYAWDVHDGRGTISIDLGPVAPAGTVLELKYLAVYPFHARVPASLPPGTAPLTFREDHPEIVDYAAGIALATQILVRESADRRELEVFTDVDGFLPGQALDVNTTHRGGIVAEFLVAGVRIKLVNAELWEYSITGQQSDEYAGSYVDQWKALTSGGSSSAAPGTIVDGGAAIAGDIYSDGRQSFRADQSMGGHKLRFVDDPEAAQDAATKAYVDTAAADAGYFEPLTNGDPVAPEIVFDSDGDVIMVEL